MIETNDETAFRGFCRATDATGPSTVPRHGAGVARSAQRHASCLGLLTSSRLSNGRPSYTMPRGLAPANTETTSTECSSISAAGAPKPPDDGRMQQRHRRTRRRPSQPPICAPLNRHLYLSHERTLSFPDRNAEGRAQPGIAPHAVGCVKCGRSEWLRGDVRRLMSAMRLAGRYPSIWIETILTPFRNPARDEHRPCASNVAISSIAPHPWTRGGP